MDLEAGRKRSGFEDLFVSYHAEDDVQATYAGALFHNGRNYHISSSKNNVSFSVSHLMFVFDTLSEFSRLLCAVMQDLICWGM